MLRTILALSVVLSARASAAPEVVSSLDPHSIENEAIANFIDWVSYNLDAPRGDVLTPRVREALRARVLDTTIAPRESFWGGEPLAGKVDALGNEMGELLIREDLTASQRVQGALEILSDLTVALVRGAGQKASRRGPILIGLAGIEAVAAGLYGLDHGTIALVTASLGVIPAGAALLPAAGPSAAPHAERLRIAEAFVERFWRRTEERWRDDGARTVPAGTSFVEHVNDLLVLDEAEFMAACEEWLAKAEPAPQAPGHAG